MTDDLSWVRAGVKVEFELSKSDNPRWNYNTDSGETGKWIQGKITKVEDNCFRVSFPTGCGSWWWPLQSHIDCYKEGMYSWPGYLRPVNKPQQTAPVSRFRAIARELFNDP